MFKLKLIKEIFFRPMISCNELSITLSTLWYDVEVSTACESSTLTVVHGCNYLNIRAHFYENEQRIKPNFYMIIQIELRTYY